ncbi:MAG: hypothetical protein SGJ00_14905 [bacterium]|nr:hypothetical protein [bacterium]
MEIKNHVWSFSTVGGVKRVNLESGADLLALETLDQKLWTALSCPVDGLEIDAKTLNLIDADKDGQIRVPEILAAVKWLTGLIKNANDILREESHLPLTAINTDTADGKAILDSAKIILSNLGKSDQGFIGVEDTLDFVQIFAGTQFNGDGIITTDSTSNEALIALLNDVVACVGSKADRGGKEGVDEELVSQFFAACEAYDTWCSMAETQGAEILPLGEQTAAGYAIWLRVCSKIDDYFLRCKLAAFDPQTTEALNQLSARVESIAIKDLNFCKEEISAYPLAKIEGGKSLPLSNGLNPMWEQEIDAFKNLVVAILFPRKERLSETEWMAISAQFTPYANWLALKSGTEVEPLGLERVRAIGAGNYLESLQGLIAQDLDLAEEASQIILVDQLVRYYRDLFKLLKNFVTFYDFYTPGKKAIFQAGTLYIDQRSCTLCIKVNDMGRHDAMVSISGMFLMYCRCVSKHTGQEMIIAAALTNGDIDDLIVGRNALFYDRDGLDWDATVIKIVDNPISIRQAFWTPYRKISRFVEAQVNKFAAAQDDKVQSQATSSIEKKAAEADSHANNAVVESPAASATPAAQVAAAAPPPPFDIGKFVGIFAALSLAMGAIGAALASIIAGFLALTWWKIPLAFLAIILLISGPSMIIAYLKLRKRNLAPILDANGWAINARATVNISFGNLLTQTASLPINSRLNLNDPFRKKGVALWKTIMVLGLLIGAAIYLYVRYWG